MSHSWKFAFIIAFILGYTFTGKVTAQQTNNLLPSHSAKQPAILIINTYETRHNVRIYYKPEWFEGKYLDTNFVERPAGEFLQLLAESGNCSLVSVDSVSFVFINATQVQEPVTKEDLSAAILIGNMQEYGKFRKVTAEGRITDGSTGESLPGVTVYIEKLNLGAVSDRSGNYSLQLPVGEYTVRLTLIGYEETERRIKVVSNGRADFELFNKSVNLPEVVIASERAEYNISRTQMSFVKLDAKSIKELPNSLGESDLIKSITLLPGIQSSGEFGTGFFVRGGSSDQNLILIEDVPIFNSSHLFGLTSIVNTEGISSATLLKAGIPARYGERASSVMDIRMGSNPGTKAKVKGGIGLINSKLSVDIPVGKKITVSLGGRTSYSDWLLHKIPDADLMNSAARFYDLNGMLTFAPGKNNKFSLFGYRSTDKFGISNSSDYNYGNTLGSFKWHHLFSTRLTSLLVAGFSHYNYFMAEYDSNQPDEAYKIDLSLLYKTLRYNISWNPGTNHAVDLGVNVVHYLTEPGKLTPYDKNSLLNPVTLQSEKALECTIYASDNVSVTPRLSAEIGLRFTVFANLGPGSVLVYDPSLPPSPETITDTNWFSKNEIISSYSGLEPRISLRYSLDGNSSVKLSYNLIHQYINLVSNTTVMNPADSWKLSNRYIKPLACGQYAAGYFRNFMNNTFETSFELYFKQLQHIIEYRDGAVLVMNPAIEAGLLDASGFNYGAEVYINKNKGRLTGWVSYAYSVSKRHTTGTLPDEQVNRNSYYPSTYDQPHNLNIIGNYHISRRWRFSWTFTYRTGRPVTLPELTYTVGNNTLIYYSDRNKFRLPDYHRLDLAITCDESLRIKKFWKGSWTFSIVNLYGRKNAYSVYFQKADPSASNNYKNYSLYMLYMIGRPLPTLTYNFSF